MKNSNSEKLFELLSQLDDDILEEALQANDKKSFKKTAKKSKIIIFRPLFVKIALWVLCIAIGVSALAINANNINNSLLFGEKSSNSVLESEDNQLSNSQTSKEDFSENQNNSHSQGAQSDNKSSSSSHSSTSQEQIADGEDVSGPQHIESIDKFNFYATKILIENENALPLEGVGENSVLPTAGLKAGAIQLLGGKVCYKFDLDTEIWVRRVSYFTIVLDNNHNKGFLANKLGGTGMVEVVIVETGIYDMITFKRGQKYYSCMLEKAISSDIGAPYNPIISERMFFTTKKYIDGFNVVEGTEKTNFQFMVHFKDHSDYSEIIRMTSTYYKDNKADNTQLVPDTIVFNKDSYKIKETSGYFTIRNLENYLNKYAR